ncbi:BURP domain-containing protein 11 [Hordeum vulgare]|nr:BURP domain-containing protein 11 [Hordeum vulgare]
MLHGSQIEEEVGKVFATHRANMEENLKEISVSYGLEGKKDSNKVLSNLNKIFAAYRPWKQENLKEISVSYGSKGGKGKTEVSRAYRLEGEKELKEISLSYGVEGDDVLKEISVSYGAEGRKSLKEGSVSSEAKQDGKLREISVSYGLDEGKDEDNKFLDKDEEDPHKATMSYGFEHEDDPHKATMSYGSEQEEDPHKATMSYGSEHEDDPYKATMSYGSEHEDDPHKVTMSYVPRHEKDLKTFSTRHTTLKVKGEGSHHAHSHNHGNKKWADVFFFHDMLRPGSVITPTIPPTTSLPALLPRGVAESIPFSMERISDIMAILAPASLAMAREIRWTLDTCDHPRTLSGQKAGCATSLESLADLAASLHGTHNVRAFSAANLPIDAAATPALRGMYNVTAMRKLSESLEIVTCHDLTYPYAVYYCHTANPTAAYSVTLASMDGVAAPAVMEALAVCHLDTSQWSPKNPFFELHNLKPGDVSVCHFLTKLSIIWVRGGEQGDVHVATR